jgi:hypothetical protein
MCRLRHINDPVLSSLKMEGVRLLFLCVLVYFATLTVIAERNPRGWCFSVIRDCPGVVHLEVSGLYCTGHYAVLSTLLDLGYSLWSVAEYDAVSLAVCRSDQLCDSHNEDSSSLACDTG